MSVAEDLLAAAERLCAKLSPLRFAEPVVAVYNPLIYAHAVYAQYLRRFATPGCVLFLGMNPGPFGMAQTGIPFGDVAAVRDWMGLSGTVGKPPREHPKRPVLGLSCPKSEVSGQRLWGLFRERFVTPERFFAGHFVGNWCPLAFLSASGANVTPDKLAASERHSLEAACGVHLAETVRILQPRWVVGVGTFATARARETLAAYGLTVSIGTVLHPSPASPAANRGWAKQAERQLVDLGIW